MLDGTPRSGQPWARADAGGDVCHVKPGNEIALALWRAPQQRDFWAAVRAQVLQPILMEASRRAYPICRTGDGRRR